MVQGINLGELAERKGYPPTMGLLEAKRLAESSRYGVMHTAYCAKCGTDAVDDGTFARVILIRYGICRSCITGEGR